MFFLTHPSPSRKFNGNDGTKRVKSHRWFRKINWEDLKARKMTPPIIPVVTKPELAENFSDKFTSEAIKESPVDNHGASLEAHMRDYFQNFSYVAHSHVLTSAFDKN
ncbi:hypothetical protein BDB00DRAFT_876999 [Zychaea mexicana]|uniref:uncharacterized protein n=1 Tax=Zychaea mexicana TaxID=64656 RepID=UPI0022FF1B12|nr:uncharacterized protein BDB00DRAFT_876999 [Zychaea mexicana]KAI9488828.1 hypothetical protein BDB00DRAFT_876999 [Zychaea mexicana]